MPRDARNPLLAGDLLIDIPDSQARSPDHQVQDVSFASSIALEGYRMNDEAQSRSAGSDGDSPISWRGGFDHRTGWLPSRSGQEASRGEMMLTVVGQWMPSLGSSYRIPRSCRGE